MGPLKRVLHRFGGSVCKQEKCGSSWNWNQSYDCSQYQLCESNIIVNRYVQNIHQKGENVPSKVYSRVQRFNSVHKKSEKSMSNNNKRQKNNHHSKKSTMSGAHIFRVFLLYFVIFGTIVAFVGLIGDDGLPGSGWFIWLLGFVALIISIVATVTHIKSGERTSLDKLADKW